MNFNDIFTNKDGRKFKLVVILDRDFKKGYTTSDVLSEVKKRGYVIPDKEEAYALKLDKNLAKEAAAALKGKAKEQAYREAVKPKKETKKKKVK